MPREIGTPSSQYLHMNRDKAQEIKAAYFNREGTQKELAARYGVSQSTVNRAISGVSWR